MFSILQPSFGNSLKVKQRYIEMDTMFKGTFISIRYMNEQTFLQRSGLKYRRMIIDVNKTGLYMKMEQFDAYQQTLMQRREVIEIFASVPKKK
jgi:hypothetical protein